MSRLSDDAIAEELAAIEGWALDGAAIRKSYRFRSFADAIAFVTRVALDAEAADHHPDMHVSYRTVSLAWTTHSEGGLTRKDFEGARRTDAIATHMMP